MTDKGLFEEGEKEENVAVTWTAATSVCKED